MAEVVATWNNLRLQLLGASNQRSFKRVRFVAAYLVKCSSGMHQNQMSSCPRLKAPKATLEQVAEAGRAELDVLCDLALFGIVTLSLDNHTHIGVVAPPQPVICDHWAYNMAPLNGVN